MPADHDLVKNLRGKANELGFDLFGIAKPGFCEDDAVRFSDWLQKGYHGNMVYMARNIEKRMNPILLVPDARSIIVTGLNYWQDYKPSASKPVFAKYALGTDYHQVMKELLHKLLNYLQKLSEGITGRIFVDTAPVKENVWAQRAGLGWIGKNSILTNRENGSFFFLGVIITSAELPENRKVKKGHCGNCRICIEACPTKAINENRTLDARKCISYLTIEHKSDFDQDQSGSLNRKVFGCDVCQDVCPWNRRLNRSLSERFKPLPQILEYSFKKWNNLTEDQFKEIFHRSPVLRTGYNRFMRNLKSAQA